MKASRRWLLVATLCALSSAACGDGGESIDGPPDDSPPPALIRVHPAPSGDGMAAIVSGVVEVDLEAGCVWLSDPEGTRHPVIWPAGTSAQADPLEITLPDGQVVRPGDRVEGGGGYVDAAAMTEGLDLEPFPPECIHVGEAAVFNASSELAVAAGVGLEEADTLIARFSPPESLGLELIAVAANARSVAIVDFVTGTVHRYGPDDYTPPPDAIDGASGGGGFIHLWANGTVSSYPGRISDAPLEYEPEPVRNEPGIASTLQVVPAPDGERVWLVQTGIADQPTLVELINLVEVQVTRLAASEIDGSWLPAGSTTEGLVLVTDEPEPRTALVSWDAAVRTEIPGTALSVGWNGAAVRDLAGALTVTDAALANPVPVEAPEDGAWVGIGGPMVPATSPPVVTGRAQFLVMLAANPPQGFSGPGSLVLVDRSGRAEILHHFETGAHTATWTRDEGWVAVVEGGAVTLIEVDSGTSHPLGILVPDSHWVLAAG